MRMNARPVRNTPKIMRRRGPKRLSRTPTKGEMRPLSVLWRESTPAVAPRLQPNCSMMGSKKAPKPCQKTAEVYAWTEPPAATIHQP